MNNKKKITKVVFLFDQKNNWIKKYFKIFQKIKNKKYNFKFSENYKNVIDNDIVFILGYTKILNKSFLKKNILNLIIHESDLPQGKGFSPVQWQILEGKTNISICLIEADKKPFKIRPLPKNDNDPLENSCTLNNEC